MTEVKNEQTVRFVQNRLCNFRQDVFPAAFFEALAVSDVRADREGEFTAKALAREFCEALHRPLAIAVDSVSLSVGSD